ncbi:MAG: hypothetical protein FD153_396 [Rhodospirillaceae bacterium]|nr:MAG: hypothetical protein FD153_396 [Rhodospirillaceae bacterium]
MTLAPAADLDSAMMCVRRPPHCVPASASRSQVPRAEYIRLISYVPSLRFLDRCESGAHPLILGYRLLKALGSLIIIALGHWTLVGAGVADLGWVTLLGCVIWAWVLVTLHRQYLVLVNPKERSGA